MKWLAIGVVLLSASAWAQESLTVEQAVSIGIENSLSVKTQQSRLKQAEQQSRQALGLLGFRLDGIATYERYDPRRALGPSSSQVDAQRASLALSYPIDVVGLGRKAARAAKANENATREGISTETLAAKKSIREAFFNVLRADWSRIVQAEALQAAKDRLVNVTALFNAGQVARFDVLRLETEVSRNESNLESAKNNITLAKQVLNNTLAREISTEFQLDTPYADVRNAQLPVVDTAEGRLLELAYATRPELKQLDFALQAQRFFTVTESGGLTPSLRLQALYSHDFKPSAFSNRNSVTLAAELSFPLWDSGITRARVAAAKETEKQVQLNIERSRLGIALEVRSAIVRLRNADAQVRFALKTVELQTEALRLAELRYREGEGILLDVTTADADLRAALGVLVNARAEYLISLASLQQAVGTDALPALEEEKN